MAEAARPGVRRRQAPLARTPRITRLMALAIRIDGLAREGPPGAARDLAAAGQVSPSRMSQIRRLTQLAPAIQEELLFLPNIISGRDPVYESALRSIAAMTDWEAQMKAFRALMDNARRG